MNTFKQGNWSHNATCSLCNKASEGEVVLVPVAGTQEGNIAEATQVHTQCIQDRFVYDRTHKILYAKAD